MHDHLHHDAVTTEEDKAVCPVMNVTVSKSKAEADGLVTTYDGKTYYLCCRSCIDMFDKNPIRYTGK